jgi:signal-transduction protein with cAMP-binding, CBS, and nucleotidyltransferase domain
MVRKINFKPKGVFMTTYEVIPTNVLAPQNVIISPSGLPELVHLKDSAKSIFIDFTKVMPVLVTPQTTIDAALYEMHAKQVQMLLIQEQGNVVGLISQEDLLSERPIQLMHEKNLTRAETTIDLLMKPRHEILVIDATHLQTAQVGHIINTIKQNATQYIFVIEEVDDKHLIKGLFSASQIGKQLHIDITSILTKDEITIVELKHERKI